MSFYIVAVGATSVALSVYGATQQSKSLKESAKYQNQAGGRAQAVSEFEAKQIEKQTSDEIKKVRRNAINYRASQVASQVQSGVVIGDGSTQALLDETTSLAEQDAIAIMYNGSRGILSKEEEGRLAAEQERMGAKAAYGQSRAIMIGATANAIGSLGTIGMTAAKMSPTTPSGSSTLATGGK